MKLSFGGRRTGRRARLQARRDEFIRSMAQPVVGLDVAGCGCMTTVEAIADANGVVTVRDLTHIPCTTHQNGDPT